MKTSIKTTLLAAVMSLAAPLAAHAQDDAGPLPGTLTGNIALSNDYIFRGVTQSSHNAVVQGGLDWDTGAGFHFGTWGSAVNFADGNGATEELDLYGGYGGKIDNFSYDVGGIFYWYPGSPKALNYNLWEAYAKAGYDFGIAAVTLGVNYSPDNFGSTGDATYLSSLVTVPVGEYLTLSLGADHYLLTQGIKDYSDWNLGGTVHVGKWFDVDARYYNTDAHYLGTFADDRFVVAIKRTF